MPMQAPGPKARKEHVHFPLVGRVPWFREPFKVVEPIDGSFLKAVWAEYLCTLLFLYLSVGSVIFGCSATDVSGGTGSSGSSGGSTTTPVDCLLSATRVQAIATSFGLTIFVLVYVASAFSGGHLNPAVSFGFLLARKISVQRFFCYLIAQLVGAITGSALVFATFKTGFNAGKGGTNRILAGLPYSAGWLMECILTFLLVFVVFTATDQARAQSTSHLPILAPAAIGMAVFVCHLAAVPIDGCSINPARSFGPAVIYGFSGDHWIFWAGPFSGAFFAWLAYEFSFRPSREPIDSVDYVYQNGKAVESVRLPGYAGASGLDANQEMLRKMKEEQEAEQDGGDLEMGAMPEGKGNARRPPARRRDTADEFDRTVQEDPPNWNGRHQPNRRMPNGRLNGNGNMMDTADQLQTLT